MNIPTLPLTNEELSTISQNIEEFHESPQIREITVRKKTRKTKKQTKIAILQGTTTNFRLLFPNFIYLLNDLFSMPIEAELLMSLVEVMRPAYLTKGILLLDSFEVSRLSALYNLKDFKELSDYFQSLSGYTDIVINQVSAILFSTTDLAKSNSFVMDYNVLKDKNGRVDFHLGHFVFFNFNLTTSVVNVVDTLNSTTVDSLFFSTEQIKKLGLCLLRASSSNHRKVKNLYYKKTLYTQQSTECGTLALLNLILTFDNEIDFLTAYLLTSYSKDLINFRSLLAEILLSNNIPLFKLKIN